MLYAFQWKVMYDIVQTCSRLYFTRKHNARQIVEQLDSGMMDKIGCGLVMLSVVM